MADIPIRSRLYNIEPIGLNTPDVESFTSYVSRLAEAHCVNVGALLNKEAAPLKQRLY